MKGMSLDIRCEGLAAEMARAESLLRDLGGLKEQKACRVALRAALASARKEAASIARDTYTARKATLFDRIEADYAGGKLTLHGTFGLSLYHFKPSQAKPGKGPAGGVTSQVKRKGPRYAHRDPRFSHGAPFVMAKRQGGYGIFVRRTGGKLPGWKGVHMLFGPSPIQALMRADKQALVAERATETFREKIEREIDKLLATAGGR